MLCSGYRIELNYGRADRQACIVDNSKHSNCKVYLNKLSWRLVEMTVWHPDRQTNCSVVRSGYKERFPASGRLNRQDLTTPPELQLSRKWTAIRKPIIICRLEIGLKLKLRSLADRYRARYDRGSYRRLRKSRALHGAGSSASKRILRSYERVLAITDWISS